ncbi:heparan sulfate 2-O-sulfotransferase 1-like [Acanthaster planci]|uniref:Heparan sulfate 2-O-sulfotransferase 1-like n=1 Tax=Acanthaster planci TaxID=133434 RepID=A0A8B7ZLH5_ACAPL|nr:heparan sulfate 2-O-sulfotransferase 1-like [Acanthaster planci]XP_022106317.1 heparan sulfate 2-O-sulfotransferase 1-like [Acanthaster planci]XP_022106318.1 heparan sulfate 2-O-sulfotransferase 1-like [Acanthaster planci]XP_022106319.1 heparan sulfate 2-O-sulfotransferase 1-like [Acanthaster planci]XP_022106320.1 heparan sulfate 2-O-sulfotransferase 1-like [Acanthaster planci]XP_022106321.1 heparan sulfate 2-O-sulfotransferase 1-like [Acanthaster planci]XP_022106322.1 heparan sulfate 2-O-
MAKFSWIPHRAMLQNRLSVVLVVVVVIAVLFLERQIHQLNYSLRRIEESLERSNSRRMRSTPSISNKPNTDDFVVIYNRVPKTGSTSFTGIAYDLCHTNKFNVLHINTTRNMHTMSVADQMKFVSNVTSWTAKKPAFYHGHLAFIDFGSFGSSQQPLYINIIRRPLDRLVSYYYFLRNGDDLRPKLKRARQQGHTNKETFDQCVARRGYDCSEQKLWIQVPFFCGHAQECWVPGSRWALEQAKFNLANHYLLVGVTEELEDFVIMLESALPSMFRGAVDLFRTGQKSHLRKTANKLKPSDETIEFFKSSPIWEVEEEFYNFVLDNFHMQKKRSLKTVDGMVVPVSGQFLYEKIRPK